ncbi:MAG TPA: EAL domain-containing protein, partial [Acidimicrobiales bacterium]|nr:EAL domain-containing protein [Acidimicrobiales bacterium]
AVVAALALRDDSLSAVPLLFMTVVLLLAFRAYGKERTRLDSLEFLHRASQVTQGTGDLDEILVTLLEHVREMFQATAAELVMLDERGGGAKLRTTVGLGPVPEVMAPDESVLTRTALLSVSSSPACIVRAQLGQAMVARLVDDAGVLGALVAATPADASGVFTKEQLRLFEALANHVTVSLVNGTLERSITQLRELHHQLSHKASHDPLTGLANRALFRSRLQDSVDTVESGLAVLFIDLDDFKVVNDTLGHEAGDQLLSVVASRIERCARTGDVAARVGGDEFAVLLHDVDDAAATAVADRILADLRAPMALDGRRVSTRASIGLVMVDHRGPADEFMRQADIAMYSAKHAGKGRYRFLAHEVGTGAVTRRALKEDLQRALRSDEFENYYQPIVDVPSGIVVGVESLVRWHHPSAGLVQPDHFIPLAEETGAIVPMGRKVLESACRDAAYWRSLNSALTLNVNISARQLHGESFVDDLSRALSASGLPAEALIIEITESTTVGDIDAVVAKLQAAKDLGVRVALDHFGTGYSSLAQMRRLPIDELKIPKPFIDEVGGTTQDRRGVTLVHAIARLGQTLGLEVVAEGIERVEQYEQLKRLPLSGGQGYFFGRPVDAEEMSALIRLESRGTASGPHMNEAMPA